MLWIENVCILSKRCYLRNVNIALLINQGGLAFALGNVTPSEINYPSTDILIGDRSRS